MDLPVMPPVRPMLAKSVSILPAGMLYEPKWDGFRCVVFRDGDEVELGSRNERPMTRYFPELVQAARRELPRRCVVDGEVVVASGAGLDFEALPQRIHPADSRVRLLAAETPALERQQGPVVGAAGPRAGGRGGLRPHGGQAFRDTAQFRRWRPDRDPRSCTYEQLERPVGFDLSDILAGGSGIPGPKLQATCSVSGKNQDGGSSWHRGFPLINSRIRASVTDRSCPLLAAGPCPRHAPSVSPRA
jgi:hypothetical protein